MAAARPRAVRNGSVGRHKFKIFIKTNSRIVIYLFVNKKGNTLNSEYERKSEINYTYITKNRYTRMWWALIPHSRARSRFTDICVFVCVCYLLPLGFTEKKPQPKTKTKTKIVIYFFFFLLVIYSSVIAFD